MTMAEAKRLVAMLASAWPKQEIRQDTLEVYALALGDLDYELAKTAVMRLVQTATFFPAIAEVRAAAVRDRVTLPTAEEAWGIVRGAIGRHGSYRVPVFDCDEVQLAVDAIGWKEICLSENPASSRARWIDAFKAFVGRRMDAEARGAYRSPERHLPAASDERELGDVRVLVETGYPTLRVARPALRAVNGPEAVAEIAGDIVDQLTDRLTRRPGVPR